MKIILDILDSILDWIDNNSRYLMYSLLAAVVVFAIAHVIPLWSSALIVFALSVVKLMYDYKRRQKFDISVFFFSLIGVVLTYIILM